MNGCTGALGAGVATGASDGLGWDDDTESDEGAGSEASAVVGSTVGAGVGSTVAAAVGSAVGAGVGSGVAVAAGVGSVEGVGSLGVDGSVAGSVDGWALGLTEAGGSIAIVPMGAASEKTSSTIWKTISSVRACRARRDAAESANIDPHSPARTHADQGVLGTRALGGSPPV